MNNISMQAGSGRSYRYLQTTPSWPFGAGMSFTSFSISVTPHRPSPSPGPGAIVGASTGSRVDSGNDLLAPFTLAPTGAVVSLVLKVTNTGSRAGANVATSFATWAGGGLPVGFSVTPLRWMVSFGKTVDLEPGESVELDLSFPREELKLVSAAGDE